MKVESLVKECMKTIERDLTFKMRCGFIDKKQPVFEPEDFWRTLQTVVRSDQILMAINEAHTWRISPRSVPIDKSLEVIGGKNWYSFLMWYYIISNSKYLNIFFN